MEVGTINTAPINIKPAKAGHDMPIENMPHISVGSSESTFNFEKAMMKPDEVKNFLYMIIGASGVHVISNDDKIGSSVNKLV